VPRLPSARRATRLAPPTGTFGGGVDVAGVPYVAPPTEADHRSADLSALRSAAAVAAAADQEGQLKQGSQRHII